MRMKLEENLKLGELEREINLFSTFAGLTLQGIKRYPNGEIYLIWNKKRW